MATLDWSMLLSTKRKRMRSNAGNEQYVARNEFESDYDRIVGSSSVRRLQDKAQVFPLQENDVVRSRLTHSVEVSALARSLGKTVGKQLEEIEVFTRDQTEEFAALLQVAGLIHDLGNPPFGHYGETIIQNWFAKRFAESVCDDDALNKLSSQEKNDFLFFDGNVQNLRIVTKLQIQNDSYGANFTYATLGTIMKYPWPSHNRPGGKKKFGYFQSEEALAKDIRETLGLEGNIRHPATYLLEAADDIIYLCDDIEDGVKKGSIDWNAEYRKMKEKLPLASDKDLADLFQDIDKKFVDPRMDPKEQIYARVRNFRNMVQSYLFKKVVAEFMAHYDDMMNGTVTPGLELVSCQKELVKQLQRVTAENCYCCKEVLSLELVGDRVVSTLLDIFVNVLIHSTGAELMDTRKYSGKIFQQISPNFVYRALNSHKSEDEIEPEMKLREATNAKADNDKQFLIQQLDQLSLYDKLHLATDFIAGMTDSYAFNLYQELIGVKHP